MNQKAAEIIGGSYRPEGECVFVALETAGPHFQGIFSGVLNILTKPKARVEAREAFGAIYGVIVAPMPSKDSDWRRIEGLADRYADRILLPPGLTPPWMDAPKCPRFERMILLKTAVEIIRRTRMPMYRRVVGLVDENGEYADFLYPLLQHYTSVKVLTRQVSLYMSQSESMMRELGAPVTVCEDYSAFSDCVLIVAPMGISTSDRLPCPILAGSQPESEQHSDFITDLRIEPSPEIAALCPRGISPHQFLAALYDYCGVDSACLPANRMNWQYRQSNLAQVVRAVMQASGTLSIF